MDIYRSFVKAFAMQLEHLKTFHHVALEKSFSKAAKKLFLT